MSISGKPALYDSAIPDTVSHRPRLWWDGAVLVLFGALSLWVLALDLWQVAAHGRDWTGTDGVFLVDQMQYVAWVRDASAHGLVGNLFALAPPVRDYLQPLVIVSGGLTALGMAPWLALLLWQPVAVVAVFAAVRALTAGTLGPGPGRRVALLLGLFFVGSALLLARALGAGLVTRLQLTAITDDLSLGFWSWGYPWGLLSLAALIGAILAHDRDRTGDRVRPVTLLLAFASSLLHPWQGAVLILVIGGAELLIARPWRTRIRSAAPVIVAAAVPLAYFALLGRLDPAWHRAQQAAGGSYPILSVLAVVAPLLVPALLGYRRRPEGFAALAVRVWPPAALVVFLVCETGVSSVATHALLGISVPLAVLAVDGVGHGLGGRLAGGRGRLLIAAAVIVVLVPATIGELHDSRALVRPGPPYGQASGPGDANFIDPGERRALRFLADAPEPGGVLTRFYLGAVVPGLTGRQTWLGSPYYTPDYLQRTALTDALFAGRNSVTAARALIASSGARFALADCETTAAANRTLTALSRSVHRFGCARVFVLTGGRG